jgi:hypothetical protein
MKKILLSVAFLGAILSADAQTTVFENNFDTNLDNLTIRDRDQDGDNGLGWYNVPANGYPPTYSGKMIVLDGIEGVNNVGNYVGGTFDYNQVTTKDLVTLPAGGTAEISFDLLVFGNTASPATFSTDFYVSIYDSTGATIKDYALTVDNDSWYEIVLEIPEGLGNSYRYSLEQYDNPRVQSVFIIDNLKITHTPDLSNNEVISSKFSVSPNPANNVINITNADNMLVNGVTVADLNGRTVKNVSFDNVASAQINVADLASGMYILNVTSDKGTATKKFVKN